METMDLTGVVTDPIDAFHELLSTLSGALDVRDVFQRLSTVVARIVAHDEANPALRTEDGAHFRLYASTQEGEPELLCPDEHSALCDPLNARLFRDGYGSERGFRSGLQVPVRVDGKPIGGLMLLSHRPDAFSARQLQLAERVADYVAIAVSHQRIAEAWRPAAVQRGRAAEPDRSGDIVRAIGHR